MFGSELWNESDDIFGQFRQPNDKADEQDPQAMADAIFAQDEQELPPSCPAAAFLGRS